MDTTILLHEGKVKPFVKEITGRQLRTNSLRYLLIGKTSMRP